MDYRATQGTLASMMVWEDWPGIDDSELLRLMRIERGEITGDEAVAEIMAEKEYGLDV